jgi:hypothetical protein
MQAAPTARASSGLGGRHRQPQFVFNDNAAYSDGATPSGAPLAAGWTTVFVGFSIILRARSALRTGH